MQNFLIFAHLKPTFSILHSHFYKTPISIYLLYKFIQIKYSKPFVSWVSYAKPINTPDQPTHKNIQPTHQNPPSTWSIPTDQYPSKPIINPIKILFTVASLDPHIMSLRALPRRRFWVSCIIVCLLISTSLLRASCFLALVRCGSCALLF